MNDPTIVEFRQPSRTVHPRTLWDTFWEVDAIAREVLGGVSMKYEIHICYGVNNISCLPGFSYSTKHDISASEVNLISDKSEKCVGICGIYGEEDALGRVPCRVNLFEVHVMRSVVEFEFPQVTLDGNLLSGGEGDVARELQAYGWVKMLMERLDAEECWGAIDDDTEYQAGYGEYYGAEMLAFHFRKRGPQTVIAGLEEGVRPTSEMYRAARDAEPFLHGYRRSSLRVIDLPWSDYWRRLQSGEVMTSQLFSPEIDERICSEQTARHLDASELEYFWQRRGGFPLDGSFTSIS
ncbi:hypothetical protein OKA04_19090 [Luteolibacter flavescens]|uniref:Uncharacterized protein n=1 Tax=Luteolibacter flavescens TaxID=1859460 RepID=A0ABT3FTE9_9BACT|nr:hypothetical protein [Luteolibacter flavescens]MCW1886854.1 hypothetical protein [Luteolibacter flavescens]